MLKKVKAYLSEIIDTIDEVLDRESNSYHDRLNNYDVYMDKFEERYLKKLEDARKEVPKLEKEYRKVFLKNLSTGGYKIKKLRDIERKIEKYHKEADAAFLKTLWMFLDGTRELMRYEFNESEEVSFDFNKFEGRPPIEMQWGQTICSEETCLRRVKLILRDFSRSDTKVLFMGDDDLNSFVLAENSDFDIYVMDIDDRLLKFIKEKYPRINTLKVDLNGGVPEELKEAFDCVALNPYWNFDGIKMFFGSAADCLKKEKNSRIYLTLWPVTLSEKEYVMLQKAIVDREFIFREIIPFLDWYDISDKYNYSDISTILNVVSEIGEDMKEPLLKKLAKFPASTATMHILSPAVKENIHTLWDKLELK